MKIVARIAEPLHICKSHGNESFKSGTNVAATRAQIDYAADLIQQLGYDEAEYNLDSLSSDECSKLITDLLFERG